MNTEEDNYILDDNLITDELVHQYYRIHLYMVNLLETKESVGEEYSKWIDDTYSSTPEARWAMIELHYILNRSILGSYRTMTQEDFQPILEIAVNENATQEVIDGILDAIIMMTNPTLENDDLIDTWLWLADLDYSFSRFATVIGLLFSYIYASVQELSETNAKSPLDTWNEITAEVSFDNLEDDLKTPTRPISL